jgi:hypothetical protein
MMMTTAAISRTHGPGRDAEGVSPRGSGFTRSTGVPDRGGKSPGFPDSLSSLARSSDPGPSACARNRTRSRYRLPQAVPASSVSIRSRQASVCILCGWPDSTASHPLHPAVGPNCSTTYLVIFARMCALGSASTRASGIGSPAEAGDPVR